MHLTTKRISVWFLGTFVLSYNDIFAQNLNLIPRRLRDCTKLIAIYTAPIYYIDYAYRLSIVKVSNLTINIIYYLFYK